MKRDKQVKRCWTEGIYTDENEKESMFCFFTKNILCYILGGSASLVKKAGVNMTTDLSIANCDPFLAVFVRWIQRGKQKELEK